MKFLDHLPMITCGIICAIICAIIIILLIYAYIAGKRYAESFANNSDFIFGDYVTNKGAQRSFDSLSKLNTYGTQPFKKIGAYSEGNRVIRTVMQNLLDKTTKISEPEPKCLSCENSINKTVFFKQGPTHYLGYDSKSNAIRMISKASITADQFMMCCQWKLVLGLSGDANTCSILHMEQDCYLTRLPDDTIIIQPTEIVQGNELARQMATFHMIDGLNSRAAVSLIPLSIGKETHVRVVEVAASGKPRIVKYASEHVVDYKAATFECVDSINEYPIITNRFTVNGNHKCRDSALNQDNTLIAVLEPFQDASNGSSKRCNKSSGKRLLATCVNEGELTDAELSKAELFQNVSQSQNTNNKPILFSDEFDPKTANIFDSHTGAEFNAILNAGVSQKRNELTDNIFYKLENAKMDPDVNNLLEYNESRYNIYKKENGDFEGKIYDRIKNHTDTVDNLIIDMNNYRVKNMAQDFFFLGDKLIKSRGSNNK
jgi:hypothetical protein